jgi:hypothetical protein
VSKKKWGGEMNKIMLAVFLFVSCAIGVSADEGAVWEYAVMSAPTVGTVGRFEKQLNKLASEGWEVSGGTAEYVIIKRKKTNSIIEEKQK